LPDGKEFTLGDRKKYTFYQMNYTDIRKFIIGEKKYSSFPQQKQVICYTPLLSELIDSVETYARTNKFPKVVMHQKYSEIPVGLLAGDRKISMSEDY